MLLIYQCTFRGSSSIFLSTALKLTYINIYKQVYCFGIVILYCNDDDGLEDTHGLKCLNFFLVSAPCDIIGDISYEELRAAAYDDAKRGLSLQSIVRKSDTAPFGCSVIAFSNLFC